jgi:hypothetical protein
LQPFQQLHSLIIYTRTTPDVPNELQSVYSTLGKLPTTQPITANSSDHISFISTNNINEVNCSINQNIDGNIVVFTDSSLPSLRGCNNDPLGRSAAFGRVVQKNGGIAVVLSAVDEVCVVVNVKSQIQINSLVWKIKN